MKVEWDEEIEIYLSEEEDAVPEKVIAHISGQWSGQYFPPTETDQEEFPEFEWDFTLFTVTGEEILGWAAYDQAKEKLAAMDIEGQAQP